MLPAVGGIGLMLLLAVCSCWYVYTNNPDYLWVVILCMLAVAVLTFLFSYMIYSSNKNNSKKDLKREQELLGDVMKIRAGSYRHTNSKMGKFYAFACLMVFVFPVLSIAIDYLVDPKIGESIILALGFLVIFVFIVGVISVNNKK